MKISLSSRFWGGASALAMLAVLPVMGQAPSATAANPPANAAHGAPDPARLNALAHKLLEAALKTNGLGGPPTKPWHIMVNFQMLPDSLAKKPETGTFEEWYAAPYRWKRTYTGTFEGWNGSERSASKLERYAGKPKHFEFDDYWMTLRVSRPMVDPLYQVANLNADTAMTVARVQAGGVMLNCTSLAAPAESGKKPEWFIPTMCFDSDLHLRAIKSEETTVQFEDIQSFQGRAVARDVKVIVRGRLDAEMKVSLLEAVDTVDEAALKPAADAIAQPYVIEPGYTQPVPVYEVGTTIPLLPNGQPFRGDLLIPLIIHKDGTVKLLHQASSGFMQDVFDAVYLAVGRWRFKPYTVDGQVVEARYDARYSVDGKPFVPSYEREK